MWERKRVSGKTAKLKADVNIIHDGLDCLYSHSGGWRTTTKPQKHFGEIPHTHTDRHKFTHIIASTFRSFHPLLSFLITLLDEGGKEIRQINSKTDHSPSLSNHSFYERQQITGSTGQQQQQNCMKRASQFF